MKEIKLYHGDSLETFLLIKEALKKDKINYRDSIKRNDSWIRFLTQLFVIGTGSFGMNNEHKQYYYIYVSECDYEKAKKIILEN